MNHTVKPAWDWEHSLCLHALYEAMETANSCAGIGKELNKKFQPSNGNPAGITRNVLIGGFRRGNALRGLVGLGYEKAKVEMLLRKFSGESTKKAARAQRVVARVMKQKPSRPRIKPQTAPRPADAEHSLPTVVVEELKPVRLSDGTPANVNTLDDGMCKYPIGHPEDKDFAVCGRSALKRKPYCADHARLSYQPKSEKKRKNEARRSDIDELRRLERLERV